MICKANFGGDVISSTRNFNGAKDTVSVSLMLIPLFKLTPSHSAKITTVIRMFALPAIASSLIGSICNIADQIFIGQIIGTLANAATNAAFPLVMLMVTFSCF